MSTPHQPPDLGLHIVAPPRWDATPSATARCICGHTRTVHGREQVQALITAYTRHRAQCTGPAGSTTPTERDHAT